MKTILIGSAGVLIGYMAGYFWKTSNPSRHEQDMLVAVGFPLIALFFIGLSFFN